MGRVRAPGELIIDKLFGKITRAIDEKRIGDIIVRARVTDVWTGQLKAAGQGVYLPVWGRGTATISLAPVRARN